MTAPDAAMEARWRTWVAQGAVDDRRRERAVRAVAVAAAIAFVASAVLQLFVR